MTWRSSFRPSPRTPSRTTSGCSTCPAPVSRSTRTGCAGRWTPGRGPARGHAGPHARRAGAGRPLPGGPARPRRRHHRIGEVGTAADADRRTGARTTRPERCSFLLVDYKGGAAFAEAAALPHTVGLVTDLDGQTTARALRSLARRADPAGADPRRARRRGHRGAAGRRRPGPAGHRGRRVRDARRGAAGLRPGPGRDRTAGPVPRRPSRARHPAARAESCHPRSAPTAPSGSACARPTRPTPATSWARPMPPTCRSTSRAGPSSAPAAAGPSPSRSPGWRAAPGTAAATGPRGPRTGLAAPDQSRPTASDPTGRRQRPDPALPRRHRRTPSRSVAPLPHRPWQPPLPAARRRWRPRSPPDPAAPGEPRRRSQLAIGLVDRPDLQSREPLDVDLAEGGTVAGRRRSSQRTHHPAPHRALGEAVHRFGPDELHVHVIESTGGPLAADAASLPHAGTSLPGEDAFRTVRLVDRLGREVAARRADPPPDGWPLILLLIDGLEAVAPCWTTPTPRAGSAGLLRLLRDGAAVGLTCVVTADRAVPGGRLAAVARHRIVLPLPDRADYAVAGIAARERSRACGRRGAPCSATTALECQLALPRELPSDHASGAPLPAAAPDRASCRPTRCSPCRSPGTSAPAEVCSPCPSGRAATRESRSWWICCGRAGCWSPVPRRAAARRHSMPSPHTCAPSAPQVLRIGVPRCPTDAHRHGRGLARPTRRDRGAGWVRALADRPGVVVADDVGPPGEWAALAALPPGAADRLSRSSPRRAPDSSRRTTRAGRRPPAGRSGLLLCPGPGDADLLGVRLPRSRCPTRPGCGWLVAGGRWSACRSRGERRHPGGRGRR